jgi:hypothetical protein
MKIKLEAVYYARNEPCIRMDMLSKNRLSVRFRLWWMLHRWRQTKLTLTMTKEAGGLL